MPYETGVAVNDIKLHRKTANVKRLTGFGLRASGFGLRASGFGLRVHFAPSQFIGDYDAIFYESYRIRKGYV